MSSRNELLQQPPEILDGIVCQIGDRQDLLSFGLTAKFLASIVFPRHIQYHTVSAPLQSVCTWKHFILNRMCARYVRRVRLIPDGCEDHDSWGPNRFQVEDCSNTPDLDEGTTPASTSMQVFELEKWREQFFILALQNMPYLRAFAWRRSSPSFSDNLWNILRQKQLLVHVTLFEDWSNTAWYEDIEPLAEQLGISSMITCPVSILSVLTWFEFKVISWRSDGPRNITSMLDSLIFLCPSLETLTLEVRILPPRPASKLLLERGSWPNLRIFELRGFDLSAPQITRIELEAFLTFHTKLSRLVLHSEGYGDFPRIHLPQNSLPDLTSVCVDDVTLRTILSCPCAPEPRKIREITGLRLVSDLLDNPAYNLQGLDRYAMRAVTITEVRGSGDLPRLAALFPDIEYIDLAIDFDAPTWDEESGTMRILLIAEWAEKISVFRNLRVLRGVPFFSDSYHETDEDRAEKIHGLAMWFPRLEWFSVPSFYSRVDIMRGEEGVTWKIT